MSSSMSKSGDFPQTESKAGEFPTMEVKPLDFVKMESFDFRENELLDFSKIQVRGFLERRQHTFLEAKTHTSFFHKKESSCGSGTSTLTSLESTISGISSRKRLMRKRDLMSLLLSYPLVITDDSGVSDLKRELYYERPVLLRYVEGLIPMEIIRDVEKGERSWSISTDGDLIPEAILNLAADLAVHQLIQTLLSISKHQYPNHMKYIRLSTRSGVEKRAVKAKIEAALNDEHHVPAILNSFCGTLSIDASTYPNPTTGAENQFGRHVCQQLQLPMIEDDDILCTRRIEEEMSSNRYIVLLVDRDGEEIVDPQKLGFRKTQLSGVLVLITTESITQPQAEDEELIAELMDLEIRTNDHLLPWEVFCHNVGKEVVYSSSAILTTAVRIVEECRGHLLTILLVAKWLLRNLQDVKNWELALHKMQHANPSHATNKFRGLNRVMINTFLNLIWDGINMTQKHCLLRCLSIPEIRDGKVDCELMNDWISSLFLDAEETEQNLRQLLDNSVLLPFEDIGGRYIRLPDETYKILQLLYILNPLVLNGSGQGLTEPPEADLWHNALRVQLADNKLSELPLSPNCLGLKVLMLQSNADLTKIPSSFFVHMPLLRILDLSYTSVRELPRSFFFLEQLRELYLKGCECFMKLPPEIGNLQKLEKLDLNETQITHLPKEVQKLTNMQSLTLYFYEYRGKKNMQYSCSTIIPSGVISNLKRLKHLSIGVNPDDERWHENVQVILPEILGLEFLQTLRIYIPQLELLKLIPAHIFEVDFRFIVGCHMQRIISSIPPAVDVKFNQSDCSLKFVKGDGVLAEIKKLLRYSKALFLDRHITLKNLSEFEMKNLEQLRLCILAECKEMQTIVGGGDSNGNDDMLSHLLFLSVSHMKNLRSIWEGPTPPRSLFGMLQSLSLQSCPELMTLFSLDFLGNLSLLKELVVKDCPKLSALISRESSKRNVDTFLPKLRKLSLLHLPELTSISSGLHIGPSLKEIGFYGCPKLCSLSRNELSSQQLTVIKGEAKWWKALKDRPSDWIFSSIHEEVDVMTQLGVYNDDDIDNGPGGSVGNPSLSTGVGSPISNSPALSGNSMVKEQRDPVEEANSLSKKPRFRWTIGLHDLFVDAVERLVGPARVAVEAEGVDAFVRVGMEERYETLKDLGSGNFGVAKLAKDKKTGELVAVKYIERGEKIDENVQREIINHRSLRHPNVIRFKEVLLTPTHLAIVLEYAAGGALFERVCNAGRFSEDEARFFFQQLVSGVSYCHSMQICHRDLKLENTLLDGNPAPRLKICDFGFSKSALLHSQPKSTVGTPAYMAPEVLIRMEYDGKIADAWSCGVTLYVMLVGAYPFEDPKGPKDFRKTIQRILSVQYSIPKYVRVSAECRHLLSRIFVANPAKRITLPEIKQHPWFLKNLPSAIIEADRKSYEDAQKDQPSQSVEEIMRIIQEARKPGPGSKAGGQAGAGSLDSEDVEADELVDSSGEFVVAF